jgi:hypothetical protein
MGCWGGEWVVEFSLDVVYLRGNANICCLGRTIHSLNAMDVLLNYRILLIYSPIPLSTVQGYLGTNAGLHGYIYLPFP